MIDKARADVDFLRTVRTNIDVVRKENLGKEAGSYHDPYSFNTQILRLSLGMRCMTNSSVAMSYDGLQWQKRSTLKAYKLFNIDNIWK